MSHWDCEHATTELRARRTTVGIQYRMQCLTCGRSASNAIGHGNVKVFPPEWDDMLEVRFETAVRERLAEERAAESDQMSVQTLARREAYQRYLQSSEWGERRKLVLQRDRNTCQGCHKARADEVHHLSYAHVGRELLYELVSLCRQCHEVAHSERLPLDA